MQENMKIKFSYTNVYGETYTTEREVPEDFLEMDELEILNDTYKNFLNNLTYPVGINDEVIVLRENEYIETYCDEDCDNCMLNDEENQPCQWKE
jgi:hypothetical protein